eukprot:scaffold604_cov384-Prasinococcus_capsulatus_cf.AAC.5
MDLLAPSPAGAGVPCHDRRVTFGTPSRFPPPLLFCSSSEAAPKTTTRLRLTSTAAPARRRPIWMRRRGRPSIEAGDHQEGRRLEGRWRGQGSFAAWYGSGLERVGLSRGGLAARWQGGPLARSSRHFKWPAAQVEVSQLSRHSRLGGGGYACSGLLIRQATALLIWSRLVE